MMYWQKEKKMNTYFFTDYFTGCNGTASCCSSSNPCGVSEGHCWNDDNCIGSLVCGTDNCNTTFLPYADCCYDNPISSKHFYKTLIA